MAIHAPAGPQKRSRAARLVGLAATTLGVCELAAVGAWLGAWFLARAAGPGPLLAQPGAWLPVMLLGVPGLLLVWHGRRLRGGARLTPLAALEIVTLAALVIALTVLGLR